MSGRPAVIVHNSVSLDGAVTGFEPDLGRHYGVLPALAVDASLVGSITMATGLDAQGDALPDPGPERDRPPQGREEVGLWFLVDSQARLQGRLHELRAFPMLRDVVVLVSDATPASYLEYLAARQYDHIRCGHDRVDLAATLAAMRQRYGVTRVHVDAGPVLTRALLERDLLDELSLLVHPVVVGASGRRLFEGLTAPRNMTLTGESSDGSGIVHLRYRLGPATRP